MIAQTFQDAFSAQWVKDNLSNPTHDLILLRRLIPWQSIIDRLTPFYHASKGRNGQSLRTTLAVSLAARLRQFSDRRVIEEVKENRYVQYFCNVPDQGLQTFMNPSTLCRFRKRLGTQGMAIIRGCLRSPEERPGHQSRYDASGCHRLREPHYLSHRRQAAL